MVTTPAPRAAGCGVPFPAATHPGTLGDTRDGGEACPTSRARCCPDAAVPRRRRHGTADPGGRGCPVVAVAGRGRLRRGEPGGGHGLRGRPVGHRPAAGVAGRIGPAGGPGHRCRRGAGPGAAAGVRLAGRPHRPLLGADPRRLRADRCVRPGCWRSRRSSARPGSRVGLRAVLAERTGKAVRSPSKSTLLAHAAERRRPGPGVRGAQGAGPGRGLRRAAAGRGGRGAHRCAVAGDGACWPCPGPRRSRCCSCCGRGSATLPSRTVDPAPPGHPPPSRTRRPRSAWTGTGRAGLPRRFWLFAASAGAATAGPGHVRGHLLPPGAEHVVPRRRRARGVRRGDGAPRRSRPSRPAGSTTGGTPGCCSCCRCWWPPFRRWRSPTPARRRCRRPAVGRRGRGAGLHRQGPGGRPGPRRAAGDGVRLVRGRPGRRRGRRRRDGRVRCTRAPCRPWSPRSPPPSWSPSRCWPPPCACGPRGGGHPSAVTTAHARARCRPPRDRASATGSSGRPPGWGARTTRRARPGRPGSPRRSERPGPPARG